MSSAAQQVTEQMNAFLATAAHDIRNPFTVAAAQVQMARRRVATAAAPLTGTLSRLVCWPSERWRPEAAQPAWVSCSDWSICSST